MVLAVLFLSTSVLTGNVNFSTSLPAIATPPAAQWFVQVFSYFQDDHHFIEFTGSSHICQTLAEVFSLNIFSGLSLAISCLQWYYLHNIKLAVLLGFASINFHTHLKICVYSKPQNISLYDLSKSL